LNSPIELGIVGLGNMGVLHAGITNSISGTNVTAICEKESFLTTTFLRKRIAVYKDYHKMMTEEQLDAAFITTPISTGVPVETDLLKCRALCLHSARKAVKISRTME